MKTAAKLQMTAYPERGRHIQLGCADTEEKIAQGHHYDRKHYCKVADQLSKLKTLVMVNRQHSANYNI